MRIKFFATFGLVATAAAFPHDNDSRGSPATLEQRAAASTTTSASSKCTAGDTSTTAGVQAILDSTGAIDWLDIMFDTMPNGEKDWVNNIWKVIFPNEGTSPLTGCGDIGGDCNPDDMCSDYQSVMGYWVMRSVGILHSKINAVHDQLLWTGWLDGLSIDQISKDFSTVSPDQEWAKWISAAFSMAGGIATGIDLSKPLRGMIGFAAAGLTDVSLTKGGSDAVDTTSVENTLRNIVGAAGNYVASILTNATGGGESTTLPIYTYTTLEHGTSRFFADNTILLDENKDNSSFVAAYKAFADNVVCLRHYPRNLAVLMMRQEKKLVDAAMKTAWYVLVGEENTKEKDCTMTGAYWLEAKSGEYRCFYLTRPSDSHDCGNSDPKTV
ncbi:uncharacterized protein N7496_000456 [Penicillium cataractarum]|uniref:Uncharacterized protein n=1 Tax=Penicillium cataractarum TaxID=2100454 RepID=A0A9X0B5Y4_9EURO|nr:uncharacterized protein N7496_000456 [Penicillium cataractarum]KAJ5389388.1 hypothetical protein N7496_000456 [Penicillium cataractarum]